MAFYSVDGHFVCPSVDGRFSCFHFLAILNNSQIAAVNIFRFCVVGGVGIGSDG